MASEPSNYPDYVFVAYDEDFSAQTYDIAVSLEPGNLVGRPVKYIRHDLNTRSAPAATDTGLVTVAKQWKVTAKNWSGLKPEISEPFDERELVTRSQAEAIIAAKNATLQDAIECVKVLTEEKNKLEADNAALIHDLNRIKDHETELVNDNTALTARIKELETERDEALDDAKFAERIATKREIDANANVEALEAKLAAAEKALEFYADSSKWDDGYFKSEDDGTVLRAYPSSVDKDQGDKARAVLGGKP